jgi:hypothetical protein
MAPWQNPFAYELQNHWQAASSTRRDLSPGPFAMLSSSTSSPSTSSADNFTNSKGDVRTGVLTSAVDPSPNKCGATLGPKFDGSDRLCLNDGWYLIRGDTSFFMELAGTEDDVQRGTISTESQTSC